MPATLWKGYGGLTTGDLFRQPTGLSEIYASGEPNVTDSSNFRIWGFGAWASSAYDPVPAFNSVAGVTFNKDDLAAYMEGSTSSNRKVLMEFLVKDSTYAEKVTLCLEAWKNGDYNVNVVPTRRIYDDDNPGVFTRVDLQYQRPVSYSNMRIKLFAGEFDRNNGNLYGIGFFVIREDGAQSTGEVFYANAESAKTIFGNALPNNSSGDPNIDDDPSSPTDDIPLGDKRRGGYGTRDSHSDIIGLPSLPTLVATSSGFVTLYSVTEAIIRQLAEELYTNNWVQSLKNFFSSANDIIAGLSIVPFVPELGARAKPRIGLTTLDVAMTKIGSQYKEIDCGTIFIDEYYGSCFDYSPYTKISIYLPYVGIRSLDVDEVMNRTVGVKYLCDCYSGSCMAIVYVMAENSSGQLVPSVKYTFSGNVAQQIPTSAANWDSMIRSAISLACVALPAIAGVGAAAASAGRAVGVGANAGASAYSTSRLAGAAAADSWHASGDAFISRSLEGATMATGMTAKPTVERTGSLGSGVGFLGPQKPFIIRTTPRQSIPNEYIHFKGYPSNERATLGSLTGYVEVEDIHLVDTYATAREKAEIMSLLKGGVLL